MEKKTATINLSKKEAGLLLEALELLAMELEWPSNNRRQSRRSLPDAKAASALWDTVFDAGMDAGFDK
jgi:hypothetical protein